MKARLLAFALLLAPALASAQGVFRGAGFGGGGAPSFAKSSDATVSSPASGEYMRHNGTNWVNSALQLLTTVQAGNYTAAAPIVITDTSGTITLPASPATNEWHICINVHASNSVTVTGGSKNILMQTDLIVATLPVTGWNSDATVVLTLQGAAVLVVYDGTQWIGVPFGFGISGS